MSSAVMVATAFRGTTCLSRATRKWSSERASVSDSGGLARKVVKVPPILTTSGEQAWMFFLYACRTVALLAGWELFGVPKYGVGMGAFMMGPMLYWHNTSACCAHALVRTRFILPNIAYRRGAQTGRLGAGRSPSGKAIPSAWCTPCWDTACHWATLVDLGGALALAVAECGALQDSGLVRGVHRGDSQAGVPRV